MGSRCSTHTTVKQHSVLVGGALLGLGANVSMTFVSAPLGHPQELHRTSQQRHTHTLQHPMTTEQHRKGYMIKTWLLVYATRRQSPCLQVDFEHSRKKTLATSRFEAGAAARRGCAPG